MTTEIQEYSQTEAAITVLRKQYIGATYDVATTEGMEEARAARNEVRGYRTALETKRQEIKAPALEQCRLIDSEAKRITRELRKIENPIADQIEAQKAEFERERQEKIDAEAKRVEDIQGRIKSLRDVVQRVTYMGNPTPMAVSIIIDDVEAIAIDDSFAEFIESAAQAKEESLAKLLEIHGAAVQREEEEKKLAAEREAQKEAQDKLDADAKKLADERAAFEKEQREAKEREEAEAKAQAKAKDEAEAAAKKAKYPGDDMIIKVLADHFGVKAEVATGWLTQFRTAA